MQVGISHVVRGEYNGVKERSWDQCIQSDIYEEEIGRGRKREKERETDR